MTTGLAKWNFVPRAVTGMIRVDQKGRDFEEGRKEEGRNMCDTPIHEGAESGRRVSWKE